MRCGGYAYSTPTGWRGQPVTVRVHPGAGGAALCRAAGRPCRACPTNGSYSLLPEHRAPLFVKPRGKVMAQRQILMDLCPEGERFFTELVHRRPQTWREQDLPGAWALFESLGEQRMGEALRYCVAHGAIGAEYLRAWATGMVP